MEDFINRKIAAAAVCSLLILCSCGTSGPVVFDNTLPAEQSSSLFFYKGLAVTEYNGISVPVKKKFGVPVSEWQYVTLPPGEAEFTLDVKWTKGKIIHTGGDLQFKYVFEPGLDYCITFTNNGGPDNDTSGVVIYQQTPPKKGMPKEENWLAFIPFFRNSSN